MPDLRSLVDDPRFRSLSGPARKIVLESKGKDYEDFSALSSNAQAIVIERIATDPQYAEVEAAPAASPQWGHLITGGPEQPPAMSTEPPPDEMVASHGAPLDEGLADFMQPPPPPPQPQQPGEGYIEAAPSLGRRAAGSVLGSAADLAFTLGEFASPMLPAVAGEQLARLAPGDQETPVSDTMAAGRQWVHDMLIRAGLGDRLGTGEIRTGAAGVPDVLGKVGGFAAEAAPYAALGPLSPAARMTGAARTLAPMAEFAAIGAAPGVERGQPREALVGAGEAAAGIGALHGIGRLLRGLVRKLKATGFEPKTAADKAAAYKAVLKDMHPDRAGPDKAEAQYREEFVKRFREALDREDWRAADEVIEAWKRRESPPGASVVAPERSTRVLPAEAREARIEGEPEGWQKLEPPTPEQQRMVDEANARAARPLERVAEETGEEAVEDAVSPVLQGRRRAAEPVAEERRGGERREDLTQRKRVAEMTPGEMQRELLVDDRLRDTHGIEIPNRRAFEESEGARTLAWDADGLKWFNDNIGEIEGGDAVLAAIAEESLGAQGDVGAERVSIVSRYGGDEYAGRIQADEDAAAFAERLNERLADREIELTLKNGETVTAVPRVTYGVGADYAEASGHLKQNKAARQAAGVRAERGREPVGVLRAPEAAGQPADQGAGAAAAAVEPAPEQGPEGPAVAEEPALASGRIQAMPILQTYKNTAFKDESLQSRVPLFVVAREPGSRPRARITGDGFVLVEVPRFLAGDRTYMQNQGFRYIDKLLSPLDDNEFVRVTNKSEDHAHLSTRRHHGSKNWHTGESEDGLSVAVRPEFPATYAYYVRGRVIGQGTDGEPLLSMETAEPSSPLMSYDELLQDFEAREQAHFRALGITQQNVRAISARGDWIFDAEAHQAQGHSVPRELAKPPPESADIDDRPPPAPSAGATVSGQTPAAKAGVGASEGGTPMPEREILRGIPWVDGRPVIENDKQLKWATDQVYELQGGAGSARYEAKHPSHSPQKQAEFAATAERLKAKAMALQEAIGRYRAGNGKPVPEPKQPADAAKRQRAAKRLHAQAEKLRAQAQEAIDAPRQTNTARRARMASGAIQSAEKDKALAQTMEAVASKLESGEETHLEALRTRAQVEELNSILSAAQGRLGMAESRKEHGPSSQPYGRYKDVKDQAPGEETLQHVRYPWPGLHDRWLEGVAEGLEAVTARGQVRKAKALAKKVRRLLRGSDEVSTIQKDADLETLREARRILGPKHHWMGEVDRYLKSLDRVKGLGFDTQEQLVEGLREFIELRSEAKGLSEGRKAELALAGRKIPGFFPTPKTVVTRMLDEADIQPGDRVLEPSAGKGDIADAVKEAGVTPEVVEINSELSAILREKGYDVEQGDFLKMWTTGGPAYDKIVMNPPFEKAADIDHVRHAHELLKPGGRVVAIMGEGTFSRDGGKFQKFREWLAEVDGISERLPAGSFMEHELRKTGVNARLVMIDKAEEAKEEPAVDLTAAEEALEAIEREAGPVEDAEEELVAAVLITGKTYPVRRQLNATGAKWNPENEGYVAAAGNQQAVDAAERLGLDVEEIDIEPDALRSPGYVKKRGMTKDKKGRKAERLLERADKKFQQAEALEKNVPAYTRDWSFISQPIPSGKKGAQMRRLRDRITNLEDRKYALRKEAAELRAEARALERYVASADEERDTAFMQRRIEEAETEIRKVNRTLGYRSEYEPGTGISPENHAAWLERTKASLKDLEEKRDYWKDLLEAKGCVAYSKDNVSKGDLVQIRGQWSLVQRANPKTVTVEIAEGGARGMVLKYPYAEIQQHHEAPPDMEAKLQQAEAQAEEAAQEPEPAPIEKVSATVEPPQASPETKTVAAENGPPVLTQLEADLVAAKRRHSLAEDEYSRLKRRDLDDYDPDDGTTRLVFSEETKQAEEKQNSARVQVQQIQAEIDRRTRFAPEKEVAVRGTKEDIASIRREIKVNNRGFSRAQESWIADQLKAVWDEIGDEAFEGHVTLHIPGDGTYQLHANGVRDLYYTLTEKPIEKGQGKYSEKLTANTGAGHTALSRQLRAASKGKPLGRLTPGPMPYNRRAGWEHGHFGGHAAAEGWYTNGTALLRQESIIEKPDAAALKVIKSISKGLDPASEASMRRLWTQMTKDQTVRARVAQLDITPDTAKGGRGGPGVTIIPHLETVDGVPIEEFYIPYDQLRLFEDVTGFDSIRFNPEDAQFITLWRGRKPVVVFSSARFHGNWDGKVNLERRKEGFTPDPTETVVEEVDSAEGGFATMPFDVRPAQRPPRRPTVERERKQLTLEKVRAKDPALAGFFGRTERLASPRASLRKVAAAVRAGVEERFLYLHHIPRNRETAFARERLRHTHEAAATARRRAIEDVSRYVKGETPTVREVLDPAGYDLLRQKVFLEDMRIEAELGELEAALYAEANPEASQDELEAIRERRIPKGVTKAKILSELSRVDGLVGSTPSVNDAYRLRKELWERVSQDLLERGVINEEAAENIHYVRHFVLEFVDAERQHGGRGHGKRLQAPYRPYAIHRKGTSRDWSTDLLEVEVRALTDIYRDNIIQDIGEEVARYYSAGAQLKAEANRRNYEMVVGGPAVLGRINAIRGEMAEIKDGEHLDSADKGRLKELSDELWEIDPTMPMRQKMAMGMQRLSEAMAEELGIEIDEMDPDDVSMAHLARYAESDNSEIRIGALTVLKGINERRAFIHATLGRRFLTPEKLARERGLVEWQSKRGNIYYMAKTLPEAQAAKLIQEAAMDPEAAGVLKVPQSMLRDAMVVGGRRKTYLVPEWLAAQLDDLPVQHKANVVVSFTKPFTQRWKRWILRINPIRYNMRNMLGDAESVYAAGRGSAFKRLREAFELLAARKVPEHWPEAFELGREHGVFSSSLRHELGEVRNLEDFQQFGDVHDLSGIQQAIQLMKWGPGKLGQSLQDATQFREDLLRAAVYLDVLEDIRARRKVKHLAGRIGGEEDIAELVKINPYMAAARVSREVLGDYGAFTPWENDALRQGLVPFYSWQKINTMRWPRLTINTAREEGAKGTVRVAGAAAFRTVHGAARVAGLAARVLLPYALLHLYNHRDEEARRREKAVLAAQPWLRARPHLTLENGVVYTPSALSDFLEWFDLETFAADIQRWERGTITFDELLVAMAKNQAGTPVDRVMNALTPFLKAAVRVGFGVSTFPRVTEPRFYFDAWTTKAFAEAFKDVMGTDARRFIEAASGKRTVEEVLAYYFSGSAYRPMTEEQLTERLLASFARACLKSKSHVTGRKPGEAKKGYEESYERALEGLEALGISREDALSLIKQQQKEKD